MEGVPRLSGSDPHQRFETQTAGGLMHHLDEQSYQALPRSRPGWGLEASPVDSVVAEQSMHGVSKGLHPPLKEAGAGDGAQEARRNQMRQLW